MTFSDHATATGLLERDFRAIKAFLVRSTVPLLYMSEDAAGIQGTGCLFEVGGCLYFVTAGHVLEGVDPNKLGVPFRTRGGEILSLGNGVLGWSRTEEFDVAAYRIDDIQTISALRDSYIVLGQSNVAAQELDANRFVVVGYPAETVAKEGAELAAHDLTQIHTSPYIGEIIGSRGEYDLFFKLARQSQGLWGNSAVVPNLPGISGGPVWQVRRSTTHVWTPESALSLVGIQISCDSRSERYMRALRWDVVSAALCKLSPST